VVGDAEGDAYPVSKWKGRGPSNPGRCATTDAAAWGSGRRARQATRHGSTERWQRPPPARTWIRPGSSKAMATLIVP
jgi:hypothetical protein